MYQTYYKQYFLDLEIKNKILYIKLMSKVSVIIPTKNRHEYLKQNLNALVKQTMPPDEVIVADNNSTDQTRDTVNSFKNKLPIKYLLVKKSGVTHARNNAVKKSNCEIIAFIDDDCVAKKDWIEKIKKNKHYLNSYVIQGKSINPNKKSIISQVMYFCSEAGIRIGLSESKIIRNSIDSRPIFFDFIDTKNLIISNKIVKRVGTLFDNALEKYNYGEDTELGIRLHSLGISSVYCEDIKVDHNYISKLVPFIKKSFLAGKTQVAVTKIIREKYEERYNQENKYKSIFGKKTISAILSKRKLKAKEIRKRYLKNMQKRYGLVELLIFKTLLYFHLFFKQLGIIYEKVLYRFAYFN